jgi:hypothetical protein
MSSGNDLNSNRRITVVGQNICHCVYLCILAKHVKHNHNQVEVGTTVFPAECVKNKGDNLSSSFQQHLIVKT